jgi:hypothetical protein
MMALCFKFYKFQKPELNGNAEVVTMAMLK